MLCCMEAEDQPAILRAALRFWGRRRRALEAERDALVQAALEAGISIEEVHQSTGLARTTVDRIGKGSGE
jgi:DNA invertase Pin-like site-specific DNA recombinase